MLFLRISVVGLTLLLGWMLGWRYGVRGIVTGNLTKSTSPVTRVARISRPPAAKVDAPAAADLPVARTVTPTEALPKAGQNASPRAMVERPIASRRAKNAEEEPAAGGLVVYEGGKEIYRVQPTRHPAATDPAMPAPATSSPKRKLPPRRREFPRKWPATSWLSGGAGVSEAAPLQRKATCFST